jgi:hypothetical protein
MRITFKDSVRTVQKTLPLGYTLHTNELMLRHRNRNNAATAHNEQVSSLI